MDLMLRAPKLQMVELEDSSKMADGSNATPGIQRHELGLLSHHRRFRFLSVPSFFQSTCLILLLSFFGCLFSTHCTLPS